MSPFSYRPYSRAQTPTAHEIRVILGRFNQHVAARRLGLDQPRMSDLLHDKRDRFSLEKLIRLLANLDRRVEMEVINEGPPQLRLFNFKSGFSP